MPQSPNNPQLEAMLKTLAGRLGTTPQKLKETAEAGDFSNLTANANNPQAQQLNQVLSDPKAAQKLLSSPQAQALLKMLGNQK